MKSNSLTRRELYDLIWSKPLRDIAADLGISDVGLAKVCERHRVPRPEQGYWNKINAGKPAKKSIFVEVDDVRLNRVEINGALSQLPPEVRSHLEASRSRKRAQAEAAARPLTPKAAISPPTLLHSAIAATATTLRKAKADQFGTIRCGGAGLIRIEVSENSVERVLGFLDRLARSLDDAELTFKSSENALVVNRAPDGVTFGLKEKTRRQKHEPTAAELDAEAI